MFHLFVGLAWLYLITRFVMPFVRSIPLQIGLAGLLLIAAEHHFIQRLVFGSMFSPEVPRWMIIAAGWAFGSFIFLCATLLVIDLLTLLIRLPKLKQFQLRQRLIIPMGLVSMLLAGIGVSQAIAVPEIRQVTMTLPNLPAELEGLKVVQLSDLHISRLFQAPWTQAVVERTNALNADLIVITGDLIDGTTKARQQDVAPLAELKAKFGVIASPGNHEYYFNHLRWKARFEELGIHVLDNQHQLVGPTKHPLAIIGLADEIAPRYGLPGPELDKALVGIPPNTTTILLRHRPREIEKSVQAHIDLQLSGHTHGGMVKGLDFIVKALNDGFVSGWYSIQNTQLYVHNGTGLWNGFPLRLGVPSEITEFTLTKKSSLKTPLVN